MNLTGLAGVIATPTEPKQRRAGWVEQGVGLRIKLYLSTNPLADTPEDGVIGLQLVDS